MVRLINLLFIFSSFCSLFALDYVGFNYVHIHQSRTSLSQSLGVLKCGEIVQILEDSGNFKKVKKGILVGFVESDALTQTNEGCFSKKYPKFVFEMELTGTDEYYLALIRDRVMKGRSKVK